MTIQYINPVDVRPNPYQPKTRWPIDPASVQELADDIKSNNLIHPPVGRSVDGVIQIGVGHRRFIAWQIAFPDQPIPIDVRELSDRQMYDYVIAEGSHRLDWSSIEKAQAMLDYQQRFEITQVELARRFAMTQGAVSNLLSLLKLSPKARDLTHAGDVPQRIARELVPLAQVAPKLADQVAEKVSKANSDEKDDVGSEVLFEVVRKNMIQLLKQDWPLDWSPTQSAQIDGKDHLVPACVKCPQHIRLDLYDYCNWKACHGVKRGLWIAHELKRLSEKLGIPLPGQDEQVSVLNLDYRHRERVTTWLKSKAARPDCLRLVEKDTKNDRRDYTYMHDELLGTNAVLLATTNKSILNQKADDIKKDKAKTETEAEKKKRESAEEHERDKRREERSANRRAHADITWLVLHSAEKHAEQLVIAGPVLEKALEVFHLYYRPPTRDDWPEIGAALDRLEAQIKKAKTSEVDALRRRRLVVEILSHVCTLNIPVIDWDRSVKVVEQNCKMLGIELLAGWNKPPVHTTESNCHACGAFTSNQQISKLDVSRGWRNDNGVVTCSDKCRTKLAKASTK